MIRSTDYNINNPLSTKSLELKKLISSIKFMNTEYTRQDLYDLMGKRDPFTCYITIDTNNVYLGDIKINPVNDNKHKYLLGSCDGGFTIFMNKNNNLIPLFRYDDPQLAIDALNFYNINGGVSRINSMLYMTLIEYIENDLSLNDTIIEIICIAGYKDDPELQFLINSTDQCDATSGDKDLSYRMKIVFPLLINRYGNNRLFLLYSNIYNFFVIHDFLNGKSKNDDEYIDLSSEINELLRLIK